MTASEFDNLDNRQKAQVISGTGTFLAMIDYYGSRSILYAIGEDFFEITSEPLTGEVSSVSPVYGDALDRYLNKIILKI